MARLEDNLAAMPENANVQKAFQHAKEQRQDLKVKLKQCDAFLLETALVCARKNVEMPKTFD